MDEATYADNWGRRAGCDDLYVPRSARDNTPMFFPTPDRSCVVHDDPRDDDDERTAEALGTSLNGFLPFEPERVGPMLDYSMTRDLFAGREKTLGDLYVPGSKENRVVHEVDAERGGVQPRTAMQSETRGTVLGEVGKNRPETTFERCIGNDTLMTAPFSGKVLHGAVSLSDTNRGDCPTGGARLGIADPRALPAPAPATTTGVVVAPTNRADCPAGGVRTGNVIARGHAPGARTDLDAPAATRKEWLILHPRQFGNPRADGLPEKGAVSGDDLPRTTARETLIHDAVAGVVTGPATPGTLPGAGNGARKTGRETLSGTDAGAMNPSAPGSVRGAAVDLAALRRSLGVTHRAITPSDAYTGPYQGRTVPGYLRQILGLALDETSRSVTSDSSYLPPARATSAGDAAPRRAARWVLDGLREVLGLGTAERKPSELAPAPAVTIGAAEFRRTADVRPEAAQARAISGGAQPGVGRAAAVATPLVAGAGDPGLGERVDDRFDPSFMAVQGAANPYAPPPVHVSAARG